MQIHNREYADQGCGAGRLDFLSASVEQKKSAPAPDKTILKT